MKNNEFKIVYEDIETEYSIKATEIEIDESGKIYDRAKVKERTKKYAKEYIDK